MLRIAMLTAVVAGCLTATSIMNHKSAPSALEGQQLSAGPHWSSRSYGRAGYSGRSGRYGLPTGRNYYNGHYYGNFNNRFYGPQYGYF